MVVENCYVVYVWVGEGVFYSIFVVFGIGYICEVNWVFVGVEWWYVVGEDFEVFEVVVEV